MKTKNDFKKININEYAFFKGVSLSESKNEFANHVFPSNWIKEHEDAIKNKEKSKYLNDSLVPKISSKERVDVSVFDFTMRSNSNLDKKCQLEYLCNYYNSGIPLQKLREHSQNKGFIKALKFTGTNSVINEIINPEQLLKIQKTWLLSNTYNKNRWSKNCIEFIETNDWCFDFLEVNMIYKETFLEQKRILEAEPEKDII